MFCVNNGKLQNNETESNAKNGRIYRNVGAEGTHSVQDAIVRYTAVRAAEPILTELRITQYRGNVTVNIHYASSNANGTAIVTFMSHRLLVLLVQ